MILETRHSIPEMLSHQPMFRTLDGDELSQIASGTYEYRVGKNEVLFHKGDQTAGMHIVISGQIKLYLPAANGAEKIVQMAGHGETFGEEGVFLSKSCPMAAQAVKDSILLMVERQTLLTATMENRSLAGAMMARLCSRMYGLIDNMETCVQRSSTQRVAYYLTQQAPAEADRFDFRLEANKQDIASQLNLAPETFSRVLARLAKSGHILIKGRSITVNDLSTLRSYAG